CNRSNVSGKRRIRGCYLLYTVSGYEFNVHIETIFKDRQIEDLWIPYFCITTDISNCKMRIHTNGKRFNGSLWRYIRASMSYPSLLPPLCDPIDSHLLLDGAFVNNLPVTTPYFGLVAYNFVHVCGLSLSSATVSRSVLPLLPIFAVGVTKVYSPFRVFLYELHFFLTPTVFLLLLPALIFITLPGSLWRYVRASMSLSGYMPPLCDPYDGSYLLDGGYVNNMPADVMATFGAKTIYAVDVGSVYDTNLTNYGDWLSGWWLIYQRLFRWRGPPIRVPNLSEIQSRLAYISCIRQLEEVKRSGICHYLRPPIDKYMTLQFSAFEEIVALGHIYGKSVLDSWQSNGLLEQMMPGIYRPEVFRSTHLRSNSVTYARDKEAHSDAEQPETPSLRHRHLSLAELAAPLGRLPDAITPPTGKLGLLLLACAVLTNCGLKLPPYPLCRFNRQLHTNQAKDCFI
ncbi:unnamed protein product, partial [Schistocephalus solidus]|uniref:PNPLA domain-containing protein n=1 Tax=Schistocephalus solidus TaxID=70667 RepID=A0A183TDV8_SCHSO